MNTKQASRRDEILDFSMELKLEDVRENGQFEGYASTFGGAPDKGGDIVKKGAFRRTIKEKGRDGQGVAMLWSHDPRCPVGAWDILREDDKGLFVKGLVEPSAMPDGVPVYKLLKMGGIKGLSIGYNTKDSGDAEYDGRKVRELRDVDLWEISLVTFPMNTRASVTSVKDILEARNERELEDALREAGLSRDASKAVVRRAKSGLREAAANEHTFTAVLDPVLAELKRINADLSLDSVKHAITINF